MERETEGQKMEGRGSGRGHTCSLHLKFALKCIHSLSALLDGLSVVLTMLVYTH